MKLLENSFMVFEVTLQRLTYLSVVRYDEYEDLASLFTTSDLRAQILYKGSSDWIIYVYDEIVDKLDFIEIDNYEGFPLYSVEDIHTVWDLIRKTINRVNNQFNEQILTNDN